jgi:hypothetical protein
VIQTAQIVLPTGRLTASAVDTDRRTIEGILVPWGEVGQPAINGQGRKVSVRRGGLLLAEKVTGIDTHDRPAREVSTLVEHEVRADGIWGRLRVDETPDGDALLGRVAAGERLGLSVEANGLLLDPTVDEVIGGTVDLVAHVDTPAFASARVHTMTAALSAVEPTTTAGEASHVTAPTTTTEAAPTEAAPALDYGQLAAALAPMLTAAAAPAGLPTGAMTPAADSGPAATDAVAQLATLQAAQAAGDTSMMAALADITNATLPIFQRPAGAIGEQLWQNHNFTRRFVPLLTAKPLTSYKFTSWEFTTGPEVDDWAGDKAPIPSNTIGPIREVEGVAERLAGGWDIDRKYRDFGDAAFWTWFYAQQTESYARKSDGKALAALLAAVQPVDGTGTVPGYTRPDWASAPQAQDDILSAVAVGTAYLEDTPLVEKGPDYVLMNTADWLSLLKLTNLDLPAFLSLLNVTPGNFQRSNKVPAGSVILGVKQAVEFYELPGAAPIRVEALDVARGGIDSAVYGYWGSLHVRPGGVISVPLASAAG